MAQLLKHAPDFNLASAERIADDLFGVHGHAQSLPSERDQNFLLTDSAGEKFVLKIANALESRAFLEAENAALTQVARRVSFCQSPVTGDIATVEGGFFARLVRYLPGVPLAKIQPACNPIGSQSEEVWRRASARMQPITKRVRKPATSSIGSPN